MPLMPLTIATKCLDGLEWSRKRPNYFVFCGLFASNVCIGVVLRANVSVVTGIHFIGDDIVVFQEYNITRALELWG